MKRATLILATLTGLAFSASAGARQPAYTPASALAAAENAAVAFSTPTCGYPSFTVSAAEGYAGAAPASCLVTISPQVAESAGKDPANFVTVCSLLTYEIGEIELINEGQLGSQTTSQCLSAANRTYVIYGHVARATVTRTAGLCSARFRYVPKLRRRTNHLNGETWACTPWVF